MLSSYIKSCVLALLTLTVVTTAQAQTATGQGAWNKTNTTQSGYFAFGFPIPGGQIAVGSQFIINNEYYAVYTSRVTVSGSTYYLSFNAYSLTTANRYLVGYMTGNNANHSCSGSFSIPGVGIEAVASSFKVQ